jgi:hypothetical protein
MNLRAKLALIALLASAVGAHAQIVPNLASVTPAGGGDFLYDYHVELDDNTTIVSGSFFTIYDFYGLASELTPPTGWSVSSSGTGATPGSVNPPDSGSVPNVTWIYSGQSISGDVILGEFDLLTTQGQFNNNAGFYSYSSLQTNNAETLSGASTVSTPLAPEPAAVGIVGAFTMLSLRRRKCR